MRSRIDELEYENAYLRHQVNVSSERTNEISSAYHEQQAVTSLALQTRDQVRAVEMRLQGALLRELQVYKRNEFGEATGDDIVVGMRSVVHFALEQPLQESSTIQCLKEQVALLRNRIKQQQVTYSLRETALLAEVNRLRQRCGGSALQAVKSEKPIPCNSRGSIERKRTEDWTQTLVAMRGCIDEMKLAMKQMFSVHWKADLAALQQTTMQLFANHQAVCCERDNSVANCYQLHDGLKMIFNFDDEEIHSERPTKKWFTSANDSSYVDTLLEKIATTIRLVSDEKSVFLQEKRVHAALQVEKRFVDSCTCMDESSAHQELDAASRIHQLIDVDFVHNNGTSTDGSQMTKSQIRVDDQASSTLIDINAASRNPPEWLNGEELKGALEPERNDYILHKIAAGWMNKSQLFRCFQKWLMRHHRQLANKNLILVNFRVDQALGLTPRRPAPTPPGKQAARWKHMSKVPCPKLAEVNQASLCFLQMVEDFRTKNVHMVNP